MSEQDRAKLKNVATELKNVAADDPSSSYYANLCKDVYKILQSSIDLPIHILPARTPYSLGIDFSSIGHVENGIDSITLAKTKDGFPVARINLRINNQAIFLFLAWDPKEKEWTLASDWTEGLDFGTRIKEAVEPLLKEIRNRKEVQDD